MTIRAGRAPRLLGAGLLAAAVIVAALIAALTRPEHMPSPEQSRPAPSRPAPDRGFPTLTPAPAPVTWRQLTLPDGTAVLSYPPSLQPIAGDSDAVSVARRSPAGAYLLYLNATPRQGTENSQNWAAARLQNLRAEHATSARQDAAASGVTFLGGTGSCVLDDYVTKTGAHHYEELACLVQGHSGASVAAPAAPREPDGSPPGAHGDLTSRTP